MPRYPSPPAGAIGPLPPPPRRLNPAKLAGSKWSACAPVDKEKHFIVIDLITPPEGESAPATLVTMEAVYSGRRFVLPWRALRDAGIWQQGWT